MVKDKGEPRKLSPALVGWAGIACSYCGKYFEGYTGNVTTKTGYVRRYQSESINAAKRQQPLLRGVKFVSTSYEKLEIPPNSIVYCDPPYQGVTAYKDPFDHDKFWNWVRDISKEHQVFVSEYNAPDDFECVWEGTVISKISANALGEGAKKCFEKLFTFPGIVHMY